jgi:uncharacterized protein with FMN-binding domain
MKKLFLSLSVIVLFSFYSLLKQNQSVSAPLVPVPTTSGNNSNSSITSSPNNNQNNGSTTTAGSYKDGEYTGSTADAFYGNIQVKAIIQNGQISDVQFLQYPNDRRNSIEINTQAMPILTQEAIQAQNANVDIVSGATDSSQAFIQSLASALTQAK